MVEIKTQNKPEIELGFELKISEDKLKVLLSCASVTGEIAKLTEQILKKLSEMKIIIKADDKAIVNLLTEAKDKSKAIVDATIVKGVIPVMPIQGKIEWSDDYFNDGYFVDPETKRIDFHRKLGDPNVEKDVLLAKVTYDKPGKDGKDVLGNVLRVPRIKKTVLGCGPNVIWNKESGEYHSKTAGRVVLKGQTVDIDES